MDIEKSRAEFEAAFPLPEHTVFIDGGYRFDRSTGNAMHHLIAGNYQGKWEGWQASRAALAVELPRLHSEEFYDEFPEVEGGAYNEVRYANAVKDAIRAAGIKIKGDAQ